MALCVLTQKAAYIFLSCIYSKGGKINFLYHLKGKVGGTVETHGTCDRKKQKLINMYASYMHGGQVCHIYVGKTCVPHICGGDTCASCIHVRHVCLIHA